MEHDRDHFGLLNSAILLDINDYIHRTKKINVVIIRCQG